MTLINYTYVACIFDVALGASGSKQSAYIDYWVLVVILRLTQTSTLSTLRQKNVVFLWIFLNAPYLMRVRLLIK